ncbi:hypothetical protein OSTOST_11763, partial [Ostertagia ostertagi]
IKRHKKPKTVMFEPPQPSTTRQLEAVAVGSIEINVYLKYLKAFSYKWALIFLNLLFCRYVMQALSSIWLSHWADANVKETNSRSTLRGLVIFIALGFGTVLFNIIATVSSTFGGVRASLALHHPLVAALMRAPLSFFEETPLGRILSRLVGDEKKKRQKTRNSRICLGTADKSFSVLFNIIATVSSTFGGVRASLALHHPLVAALMRAPLSFFEETPLGRILSRLV